MRHSIFTKKKVALVYDRVNKWGGAERVLLTLHEMFPQAPLYTSVYNPKKAPWAKVFPKVHSSFLQKVPLLNKYHELLGWLTPLAFERFNFDEYDLVITVTSEAAKNIKTNNKTKHICYCLTPTRYLWSGYEFYLTNPPKIFKIFPFYKLVSKPFLWFAKKMDLKGASRPDVFIAISSEVKRRIKKYYKKESEIIFPPVSFLRKNKVLNKNREHFLIHGRFEPYKRLDLVIDTFNELNLPLIVSGGGSEFDVQRKRAKNNIKFVKSPNDIELSLIYSKSKALIMPQEEDFGIVSIEAQSYGVPVIAYAKGGALDTVIDGRTGVLFKHQSKKSLMRAVEKFDRITFRSELLTKNVQKFSKEVFKNRFGRLVRKELGEF
ncbi:MAG TPA: glycosyltransferase [Patescibacteria group bacterium]|nr:glycosyltransferase [Patescibacteria group bacterium]